MVGDKWAAVAKREAALLHAQAHMEENGSQTTQSLIDAGLVDNADDAIEAMTELVDRNKVRWVKVNGVAAISAR